MATHRSDTGGDLAGESVARWTVRLRASITRSLRMQSSSIGVPEMKRFSFWGTYRSRVGTLRLAIGSMSLAPLEPVPPRPCPCRPFAPVIGCSSNSRSRFGTQGQHRVDDRVWSGGYLRRPNSRVESRRGADLPGEGVEIWFLSIIERFVSQFRSVVSHADCGGGCAISDLCHANGRTR